MHDDIDRHYMGIALDLAERGRGTVSPNPMVGAIVVRDGEIVGSGYHQRAGSDHAEVIALREAGELARDATLYVTLEPCCHYGRTPPCTVAIQKSGVKRVVAAMMDDNPKVCGGGASCIRDMNVDMTVGVMEHEARRLNESYLTHITTGRPFVTLKLAMTLDGRIADASGRSKWITGPEAREHVHRWRAWSDAIMVGAGTVLADDPSLTVRHVDGPDPLRIVVDADLETPPVAKVLADGHCIIVTRVGLDQAKRRALEATGAEVLELDCCAGMLPLSELLQQLGARSITSVFCEGGSTLASALIRDRLADKLMFHMAPKLLGAGLNALNDVGIDTIADALELADVTVEPAGDDILVTGYPHYRCEDAGGAAATGGGR